MSVTDLPGYLTDGNGRRLTFKVLPGGSITAHSEDGVRSASWELNRNSLKYEDGSKLAWVDYLLSWETHAALLPFREYLDPEYVLTVMDNGYGLLCLGHEFKRGSRAAASQIAMVGHGEVAAQRIVGRHDQLLLIGDKSTMIRLNVGAIRVGQRNMHGQLLMTLKTGEKIVSAEPVAMDEEL